MLARMARVIEVAFGSLPGSLVSSTHIPEKSAGWVVLGRSMPATDPIGKKVEGPAQIMTIQQTPGDIVVESARRWHEARPVGVSP